MNFKNYITEFNRHVIPDEALTPYQKYVVNWDDFDPSQLSSTHNTITREYDALNRIRKAEYPEDRAGQRKEMIPKYNKGGALLSLKVGGVDFVKEIAYNARGQRIMLAMGNGIMTRYAYDSDTFRLARTRSEKYTKSGLTFTPNGGVQQDLEYTYDLEGTITSMNDAAPANASARGPGDLLRVFTHDPLRRLLSATGRESSNVYQQPSWDLNIRPQDHTATNTYTRSYAYDKLGNIQKLKHVADGKANQDFVRNYEYGTGDNRLKAFAVNGTDYENLYDANGNLTKAGENRHYEWNANDKLAVFKNQTGASTPSVYTNYFYNAQGERVKKHTRKGNKVTVTVYMDGGMFEVSYVKPTGTGIDNNRFYNTLHVLDETSRIATVRIGNDADDPTPQVKYCLEDHLMDSLVVLNTQGNLVNREEFYPFGETSFGGFAKKRYRYNGKEKDEESGLYAYGQRYYAAWLCRFISVDPIAEEYFHLSSYNYASNRPITSIDVEGLQTPDEPKTQKTEGKKSESSGENAMTGANSKMPVNINIHNAPEKTIYEGEYGRDYGEATRGVANAAYHPSNPHPGSIQTHNPNSTKEIYWNSEFKMANGRGAYFWEKTNIEPRIEMQLLPRKIGYTNIEHIPQTLQPNTLRTPTSLQDTAETVNNKGNIKLDQYNIVSIDHMTDGSLLVDENNNSHQLDQLIRNLKSLEHQVESVTINAQIGIGRAANNEMKFSQNLYENVSNYIQQKLPDVKIRRGYVGPASGVHRISEESPLSIYINR